MLDPHAPLTDSGLLVAVHALCAQDADLAAVHHRIGPPPLWSRPPGFGTLVFIILEQQVSLASARAAYERLLAVVSPLTAPAFLALDDATLRACGFSRQKTGYCRNLAQQLIDGALDLDELTDLPDDNVRARLCALKGIGPWSAEIYLLMALCRPDAWPVGDLALAVAVQAVKRLPARPTGPELEQIGEYWRPWRAVAARILWHHYLSGTPAYGNGQSAI